MSAKHVT